MGPAIDEATPRVWPIAAPAELQEATAVEDHGRNLLVNASAADAADEEA
jgi:hypothetical protein